MLDHNPNALPIACNLSGREAARRKESIMKVLRQAVRVREIEDGYEFTFPGDGGPVAGIVELVVAERACCPFLTFGILFEAAGGPIRLRVTGPDSARELIQEELILPPRTG